MHTKCWAQCLARVKTITILSCRAPYCTWKRKQNLQVFVPWNDTAGALLLLSHWMINNIIQHLKCSFTLWASATWPVKWMDYIKLLMEVSSVPKGTVELLWSNAPGCKQIPKEPLLKVEMGAAWTHTFPPEIHFAPLNQKCLERERSTASQMLENTHNFSPRRNSGEASSAPMCPHTSPYLTTQLLYLHLMLCQG